MFARHVGGKRQGATYIGSDLLKAVGGNRLDKMLTRRHLKVGSAFSARTGVAILEEDKDMWLSGQSLELGLMAWWRIRMCYGVPRSRKWSVNKTSVTVVALLSEEPGYACELRTFSIVTNSSNLLTIMHCPLQPAEDVSKMLNCRSIAEKCYDSCCYLIQPCLSTGFSISGVTQELR